MSNNYQDWDDEDDFDLEDAPVKRDDSTDLVRKLRKAERAKEKRIRELEDELGSLRTAQRENVIKSVLSEKGINPKIAAFIPSTIEADANALASWIDEYADVFGVRTQPASTEEEPIDYGSYRQIDAITSGALTPDREQDIFLKIGQAGSAEEIINMINSLES